MLRNIKPRRSLPVLLLAAALVVPSAAAARSVKKETDFAVGLAKKGLWHEAAFRFRALLAREPDNARLWNNLAVACEATGDYPQAAEAYEKAASLLQEPPEPMASNREAFEAFYRAWQAGLRARSGVPAEPGTDVPLEPGASESPAPEPEEAAPPQPGPEPPAPLAPPRPSEPDR